MVVLAHRHRGLVQLAPRSAPGTQRPHTSHTRQSLSAEAPAPHLGRQCGDARPWAQQSCPAGTQPVLDTRMHDVTSFFTMASCTWGGGVVMFAHGRNSPVQLAPNQYLTPECMMSQASSPWPAAPGEAVWWCLPTGAKALSSWRSRSCRRCSAASGEEALQMSRESG